MEKSPLVGYWHLKTSRFQTEGQVWIEETVFGGALIFTASGNMSVFISTSEGPYGYYGKYQFDGQNVSMIIKAGIVNDLDGTTQIRKIEFLKPDQIRFSGNETHTGRPFDLILEREA